MPLPDRLTRLFVPARIVWALPWTVFGLGWGVGALATGGGVRIERGTLEFWGGLLPYCLARLPIRGGAAAITFGHVILAATKRDLDHAREHERIHVRQYERWGPFFVPVYLLAALVLAGLRRAPYRENPFEREAYGLSQHSRLPGQLWLVNQVTRLAYLTGSACFLGCFARWWWIAELATHFRLAYVAVFLAATTVWWLHGWEWRALGGSLLIAALGGPLIFERSVHDGLVRPRPTGVSAYRVVVANLLTQNRRHREFLAWVASTEPDLVLVSEVDAVWERQLATLTQFPYRKILARPDNFGIGILSRAPLESADTQFFSASGVPAIVARLAMRTMQGPRDLTVVAVHVLPPVSRQQAEDRNQALRELGNFAAGEPGPLLIAGDLNCTPWSPFFHDLLRTGRLHDGRAGFGIQPSWPAWGIPLLPLDHTLINSRLRVVHRETGPAGGSDHLPIVVHLDLDGALLDKPAVAPNF